MVPWVLQQHDETWSDFEWYTVSVHGLKRRLTIWIWFSVMSHIHDDSPSKLKFWGKLILNLNGNVIVKRSIELYQYLKLSPTTSLNLSALDLEVTVNWIWTETGVESGLRSSSHPGHVPAQDSPEMLKLSSIDICVQSSKLRDATYWLVIHPMKDRYSIVARTEKLVVPWNSWFNFLWCTVDLFWRFLGA